MMMNSEVACHFSLPSVVVDGDGDGDGRAEGTLIPGFPWIALKVSSPLRNFPVEN